MTKETIELVNLYKPLGDWFERNKETIYCIDKSEDKKFLNPYISVASSMYMCATSWLNNGKEESEFTRSTPEDRIASAVIGMAHIYNMYSHNIEKQSEREALRISYKVETYEKTM